VVDGAAYTWWILSNRIDGRERHISIARSKKGQQLHLDPYAWALEIRPAVIADAIRFGLANGWDPDRAGAAIAIGLVDGAFTLLPR
jgi:hypothetical protein